MAYICRSSGGESSNALDKTKCICPERNGWLIRRVAKIVGFKSEKNFDNIKVQICSLRSSILLKYGVDKEIIQKMAGWAE